MIRRREAGPGLTLIRGVGASPGPDEPGRAQGPTAADSVIARLRSQLRARQHSPRTEKTYVRWAERYIGYHGGVTAEDLGPREIDAFLSSLAIEGGVSPSTQNQAASALLFLYRVVLGREVRAGKDITRARSGSKLPEAVPHEDVVAVLREMSGPRWLIASLLYGSGLRLGEALKLRVKDLDLGSATLHVRQGKGRKDRTTVMPRTIEEKLKRQLKGVERVHREDLTNGSGWAQLPDALHRKDPRAGFDFAWQFLFLARTITKDPKTGRRGRYHRHESSVQRAVKQATRESGVHRRVTCHILRHSFATQLLRGGCNLQTIQELLGHNDIKTTMRYLRVEGGIARRLRSPLDQG